MTAQTRRLGDFAKVVSGYAFKSKDFVDNGIPVLKIANIKHEHVVFDGVQYLPPTFIDIDDKFKAKFGDVMICLTGSHISQPNSMVGRVAMYRHERIALVNQRAARVVVTEPEHLDKDFLYYFLRQEKVMHDLALNAGGAANQANISQKDVERLELPYIGINKQQAISSTLKAYDNLIENNKRRIALLEEAARQLYKEWFVRFRFPGHEHVKIVDGVPEGWSKGFVADLGEVVTGKTPSTKIDENYGGDIPFIKTPDMHGQCIVLTTEQCLTERGANTQPKKLIPPNSILVSCIGTIGVTAINRYPAHTNQQINAVIPKKPHLTYFSYFVLSGLKARMEAMGGGATMANVNKAKFASLPILLPSKSLLNSFHGAVSTSFEQVSVLLSTNEKLIKARDLLLPKLMNGELAV